MKRDRLIGTVLSAALIAFGILIIWLFGKYLFAGILPFLIAYPLSLIIRPASSYFSKKTKLKRNFCCVILIIFVLTFTVLLITWLISTLIAESQGLISSLITALEENDNILRRILDYVSKIKERIPFASGDPYSAQGIYDTLLSTLGDTLTRITSSVAQVASKMITKLPRVIFSLITTIIALFYFSMDKGEISIEVKKVIGYGLWDKLIHINKKASSALSNYLKSYLIIMLITFAELFLGFVILQIEYSLLLAFFIAVIDILPVLGAGTVIVPWGIIYLVLGDWRRGIGLIVLWLILYLIRQVIEPHVLGSVMGIHPVISLFSVYLGFVLFGVGGMFFLPLLTYVANAVFIDKDANDTNRLLHIKAQNSQNPSSDNTKTEGTP